MDFNLGEIVSSYLFGELRIPERSLKLTNLDSLSTLEIDAGGSSLTFVESSIYLEQLIENSSAVFVLCTSALAKDVKGAGRVPIVVEVPRYHFFRLYNLVAERRIAIRRPTVISSDALIDPAAVIADHNVVIGAQAVIEAGVVITERVVIGENTIVRANSVIGAPGFEYKRFPGGLLPVIHDGEVIVGQFVEIGAGSVIGQGFHLNQTRISNHTKLDNLVSIAHGSKIGERVLIGAGSVISGSVEIDDDVYIGPGATLSNGISIGKECVVVLGSVVFKDVESGKRVMGSPAREFPSAG